MRYHKDVETLADDHPWHRIRALVPAGARVLDVGCGNGGLGRFLMVDGREVDGIEPSPERAEEARQVLRTVVTGFAGPGASASLTGDYDAVIFADVLEHIAYPTPTLEWAGSLLSAQGRVIALIPNSANWKVRRKVLHGDWSYADTGYFDRDHVRFYDLRTVRELGPSAGLEEASIEHIPGELPKPIRYWTAAAARATAFRPNLFAGHELISWRVPDR
jgi:cyclopropane fatty-acyl-phospholipid synthase-like methyltransferase